LDEEHRRIHATGIIYYVLCELAKSESRPSSKISKLPKEKRLSVRAKGLSDVNILCCKVACAHKTFGANRRAVVAADTRGPIVGKSDAGFWVDGSAESRSLS